MHVPALPRSVMHAKHIPPRLVLRLKAVVRASCHGHGA